MMRRPGSGNRSDATQSCCVAADGRHEAESPAIHEGTTQLLRTHLSTLRATPEERNHASEHRDDKTPQVGAKYPTTRIQT